MRGIGRVFVVAAIAGFSLLPAASEASGELYPVFRMNLPAQEGQAAPAPPPLETLSPDGVLITNASSSFTLRQNRIGQVPAPSAAGVSGPLTWSLADGDLPLGMNLESDGSVAGTPSIARSFPGIRLRVQDETGKSGVSAPFTVNVIPSPILAYDSRQMSVGQFYQVAPTTSGLIGPASFRLVSGTLPSWMQFSVTTGVFSGTPTQIETVSGLQVAVDDSDGESAVAGPFSIEIGPLTYVTYPGPNHLLKVGVPLSLAPFHEGLGYPLSWTRQSGALPPGIAIDPNTGVISGVPTTAGTYANMIVRAQDPQALFSLADPLNFDVRRFTVSYAATTLRIGTPLELAPTAANAAAPVTWQVQSGLLPPGTGIDGATGVVSGVPATRGTWAATVRAQDGDTAVATANVSVQVTDFSVAYPSLSRLISQPVTVSPVVEDLRAPIAFTLLEGEIPAGLALHPATGVISGLAQSTGTATGLVVGAVDADGVAVVSTPFSLTITAPLFLTVNAPSTRVGLEYATTVTHQGLEAPIVFSMASTSGPVPAGLSLVPETGVISGVPVAAASHSGLRLRAVDRFGTTVTGNIFSIVVAEASLAMAHPLVATLDASFTAAPTTMDLLPGASYAIASGGPLPSGLQMDASGAIAGFASTAGTYGPYVMTATDANGTYASNAFSILVSPPALAVSVPYTTIRIQNQKGYRYRIGEFVSVQPTVADLVGQGTWTISGGELPEGVVLNTQTGHLSGTSTRVGTLTGIRLRVTTSSGSTGVSEPIAIEIIDYPRAYLASAMYGTQGVLFEAQIGTANTIGARSFALHSGTLPQGLGVTSQGLLYGIPTQQGTFANLVFRLTDAYDGRTALTAPSILVVEPDPGPVLTLSGMRYHYAARIGSAFATDAPTVGGATGAVSWTVQGTLPPGTSLDPASGVITGVVSTVGTFSNIVLRATDSQGRTGSSPLLQIKVLPNLAISGLTTGYGLKVGEAASIEPVPQGIVGTAVWSISGNTLPPGLGFNHSSGKISGTPSLETIRGGLAITLTDSADGTSVTSGVFEIAVGPGLYVSGPANLYARYDTVYTSGTAYTAAAGSGAVTWSIEGTLQSGLTIDPGTGVISGRPMQESSRAVRVVATNGEGVSGSVATNVVVRRAMEISTTTFRETRINVFTSFTPTLLNEIGSVSWSVAQGGLPPGMSLNPTTGRVSGVPTVSGDFTNIRLRVIDSTGAQALTQELRILVHPELSVWIPAYGGMDGRIGEAYALAAPIVSGGIGTLTFDIPVGNPHPTRGGNMTALPSTSSIDPLTGVVSGVFPGSTTANRYIRVTDQTGSSAITHNFFWYASTSAIFFNENNGGTYTTVSDVYFATPRPSVLRVMGGLTYGVASGHVLPEWLTLNTANGQVSGTPPGTGVWTYRLMATDDYDNTIATSNLFTIRVNAAAPEDAPYEIYKMRTGASSRVHPVLDISGMPADTLCTLTGAGSSNLVRQHARPLNLATPISNCAITTTWPALIPGYYPNVTMTATSPGFATRQAIFGVDIAPALEWVANQRFSSCVRSNRHNVMPTPLLSGVKGTLSFHHTDMYGNAYALPAGLTMDPATGVISGTPTATLTRSGLYIRATDDWDGNRFFFGSIRVESLIPLQFSTGSLQSVGTMRDVTRSISMGTWTTSDPIFFGEFTMRITQGTLPDGIAFSRNNATSFRLTGMSDDVGVYPFTVEARDNCDGETVARDFQLTVQPQFWYEMSDTLYFRVGVHSRSEAPVSHHNQATTSWVRSSGTLPDGLQVDAASGQVFGTPTLPGIWKNVGIRGTSGFNWTQLTTIVVLPEPSVSVQDEYTVHPNEQAAVVPIASGLVGTQSWSLAQGALPPGMTLNSATGIVSGSPATLGLWPGIRLVATDGEVSVQSPLFSISVVTRPPPAEPVQEVLGKCNDNCSGTGSATTCDVWTVWRYSPWRTYIEHSMDRNHNVCQSGWGFEDVPHWAPN